MTDTIHVILAQTATEQTITDIWTAIRDKGRGGNAEMIVTIRTSPGEMDVHLGLRRISTSSEFLAYLGSISHIEKVALTATVAA